MLMKKENIGEILTTQYDIALNGFEAGGGSIRNHKPEALEKVLRLWVLKKKKLGKTSAICLKPFPPAHHRTAESPLVWTG